MKKVIIIKDTREKRGYNFSASKNCDGMVVEKLDFGDYAIKDHLDLIVVERKSSVIELCNNLGVSRDRFERELQRMIDAGVKRKYIVVEDYWSSTTRKQKFTRMSPNSVFESIIALMVKYDVHFIFAGKRELAQRITRSLLVKAYRHFVEKNNEN